MLDTSVVSAFAPGRPAMPPQVAGWFERHSDELYLSAVTVSEIEAGIARLAREGADRRSQALSGWLDRVVGLYGERVLSFDVEVARVTGQMSDAARAQGRNPGFADVAIAATARAHDLSILTVNVRHFEPLGVPVSDPFQS